MEELLLDDIDAQQQQHSTSNRVGWFKQLFWYIRYSLKFNFRTKYLIIAAILSVVLVLEAPSTTMFYSQPEIDPNPRTKPLINNPQINPFKSFNIAGYNLYFGPNTTFLLNYTNFFENQTDSKNLYKILETENDIKEILKTEYLHDIVVTLNQSSNDTVELHNYLPKQFFKAAYIYPILDTLTRYMTGYKLEFWYQEFPILTKQTNSTSMTIAAIYFYLALDVAVGEGPIPDFFSPILTQSIILIGTVINNILLCIPYISTSTLVLSFMSNTENSDAFLILIYFLMISCYQSIYYTILKMIFDMKQKGATKAILMVIHSLLTTFATRNIKSGNINPRLILFINFLIPQSSIGVFLSLLEIAQNNNNPLSFSNLDFSIGISFFDIYLVVFLSILSLSIVLLVLGACMDTEYTVAPLGWKNLFSLDKWKRLIKGSKVNIDVERIIDFVNITKVYKTGKKETKALDGVSMTVHKGEMLLLIGANGSGKSSLINSVIGKIPTDDGILTVFNNHKSNEYKQYIAMCSQENNIFPTFTVREHIQIIQEIVKENTETIDEILNLFGLTDCAESAADKLSGGQSRKLCVAMAYSLHAPLTILDEPMSGVDAMSRIEMWRVLSRTGSTLLITSHALEEAEDVCSRICVLSHGSVRFLGTPPELREKFECVYNIKFVDQIPEDVIEALHGVSEQIKIIDNTVIVPNEDIISEVVYTISNLYEGKFTVNLQNLEETLIKQIEEEDIDNRSGVH